MNGKKVGKTTLLSMKCTFIKLEYSSERFW